MVPVCNQSDRRILLFLHTLSVPETFHCQFSWMLAQGNQMELPWVELFKSDQCFSYSLGPVGVWLDKNWSCRLHCLWKLKGIQLWKISPIMYSKVEQDAARRAISWRWYYLKRSHFTIVGVKANSLNDSLCSAAMACCVHLCRAWDTLGISFSSTKLLDKTIVAITNAVDYLVMVCGLGRTTPLQ